jgi:type 1 glutamine amidotransferase
MKTLIRLFAVLLALAPFSVVSAQEGKTYRILYITQSKGFQHGSVKRKAPDQLAPSEIAMMEIAKASGLFDVECTQDASVLTAEKLKELDAVMFYTTGGLPITGVFPQYEEWLKSGKAMIGVHSATDTLGNFKPYWSLINGTFNGHPWGSGETVSVSVHEPDHAVAKPWPAEFQIKDEIYQYRQYDPKSVRVIYSLNMAKCKTKMPYHVPMCWVREFGQGRLFYTNLGHNEGTWTNPQFREHLLAGIRWALKKTDGPAGPNPEIQYAEQARAFAWVEGDRAGKDADELAAKAGKAAIADPSWGERFYAEVEAFKKIDRKKDAEKASAEAARLLAMIEGK